MPDTAKELEQSKQEILEQIEAIKSLGGKAEEKSPNYKNPKPKTDRTPVGEIRYFVDDQGVAHMVDRPTGKGSADVTVVGEKSLAKEGGVDEQVDGTATIVGKQTVPGHKSHVQKLPSSQSLTTSPEAAALPYVLIALILAGLWAVQYLMKIGRGSTLIAKILGALLGIAVLGGGWTYWHAKNKNTLVATTKNQGPKVPALEKTNAARKALEERNETMEKALDGL